MKSIVGLDRKAQLKSVVMDYRKEGECLKPPVQPWCCMHFPDWS